MNKVIWKYEMSLSTRVQHEIPQCAGYPDPVAFMVHQTDPPVFEAWFLVDPDKPRQERTFWIRATGEPIPYNERYLATTRHDPSLTVWHLTEVIE